MSKNVGARSHASQVAADHRSRIAAGNAARLAAVGLALFLTFGFGGVAQASSAKADEKAQEKAQEKAEGRGLESSTGTSIADGAVGNAAAGLAGQLAPSAPKAPGAAGAPSAAEVIEISATSSETDASTLVVEATVDGVTTTTSTVTPNAEASHEGPVASGAVTVLAKVKGDANEGKKPETAGNPSTGNPSTDKPSGGAGEDLPTGAGNGSPDGGTYVETIVCHRDGVVIVIDDSGLNGHAADRYDTGHLEGLTECVDSDGDTVPDPVDADPLDPEVDDLTEPALECATGEVCDEVEDETGDEGAACENDLDDVDDAECDTETPGGTGGSGGDKKDDGKKDDGKKDGDKKDQVAPTVPGDKVEGPGTKGPGTWNDGAKTGGDTGGKKGDNAGGKKPEVLGEEAERPRGGKTPGKGGPTTTDVDKEPGGRLPIVPNGPQNDSTPGGEVLGEQGERPRKNRPAVLVLPQTGAASSMTAQAGAGLVMILAGALTLRGRRRDS